MSQSYMPQSKSDVHLTPDKVYNLIKTFWGYNKSQLFDPCPVNPQWNAIKIDWKPINFVNPPYSLLKEFVAKAYWESLKGHKSIMLLPCKTDQKWFHNIIIEKGYEIRFIQGRLKFKNNKWSATQPHFLVMIQ